VEHGGIDGVALSRSLGKEALTEVMDQVGGCLKWGVDGVGPPIEEKGLIAMSCNETDSLLAFAVGQVLSDGAIRQVGEAIGRKIAGWLASVIAANILVEAKGFRSGFGTAEVPFAEVQGLVTGLGKALGNGYL
jgi:hypothetical protein